MAGSRSDTTPLSSMRTVPPLPSRAGLANPPSLEAPISSRSLIADLALAPTSSNRVFWRSNSSTTTKGRTTSCSSKRSRERGSASRTHVSRTKVQATGELSCGVGAKAPQLHGSPLKLQGSDVSPRLRGEYPAEGGGGGLAY